MISYPSVEIALEQTGGNRAAARHLIRVHIMAEATRQAEHAGCSFKCRSGRHADESLGCTNGSSTCICYCHDQAPTPEETP